MYFADTFILIQWHEWIYKGITLSGYNIYTYLEPFNYIICSFYGYMITPRDVIWRWDYSYLPITMTSYWTRWLLKSPASRLFNQPFIRAQIKINIKAPRHWPLCGEFIGDRWIPRTNGQWRGKFFHLMTSSCIISMAVHLNSHWSDGMG